MVDIHNHILPGIDDGCKTIDESLEVIKEAQELGITHICFSPHYVKGSRFDANNKKKKELLEQVRELAKNNGININFYVGNEVYFEPDMPTLIDNDEITTVNGSKYLLFELPMTSELNNLKEIIFELKVKGYVPIIAHPERYSYFQKDPNKLIPLIEQGCLFQGNLGSVSGVYGSVAQKTIKIMLTHNMIHMLATDVHKPHSRNYLNFNDSLRELDKIMSKDDVKNLLEINPLKVINNENLEIKDAKVQKKSFFSFKL